MANWVSQSYMGRRGLAEGANFLLTQAGRGASILKRYLPPYP
jgi:hypothetical protein